MNALVLDRVSRTYGGLKAVDDVSLTIGAGERRALIGPNGAGKTTLFNVISGEVRVSGGTVSFLGTDVTSLAPHQRAARGMARTFQITRLFGSLSVLENVLLSCEALDVRKFTLYRPLSSFGGLREKAARVLEDFGLTARAQELAANLSYGEQRMLEVALSMAGRPRLLLLDEPMAGLSAGERASMLKVLARLDPGVAILLIEHDMDVAFGFADRVTVLDQGRVLLTGQKDEIGANEDVRRIYLGAPGA